MIAFAFLLSTFFTSARTATVVLFIVTVLSVQAGSTLLVEIVTNPTVGFDEAPYLPYMWFPPLAMLRSLLWLTYGAVFGQRCDWTNLETYGFGGVSRSLWYMFGETIAMIPMTFYLEAMFAPSGAARLPFFFPEDLKRWPTQGKSGGGASTAAPAPALVGGRDASESADVRAERVRAEAGGDNQAVRVLGLRKVFGSGEKAKVAVRDLSFAVNKNECFGLLVHKTI